MSFLSREKEEHEAFRNRLVEEVLGEQPGDDKVPMEKVVMLIWQFRDDPIVVQFMTRFVAKYAGSRDVFDGIEFYLPQLAHMIIHLEVQWDDAVLERFALVVAQQSLHFALQFNWILLGAIEDYQPELGSGEPNPSYNPLFYTRCIKLLNNIERCAVYGRPRSHHLQRLYEKGKITKKELEILEHADRRFNAFQITLDAEVPATEDAFAGTLLYKRKIRTSCTKRKPWKKRYFVVEERMLYCYRSEGGELIRAMPLEGATIGVDPQAKYANMFFVSNRGFHFQMRAQNEGEQRLWMTQLVEESESQTLIRNDSSSNSATPEARAGRERVLKDLSPAQRSRYDFFKNERDFVRNVTDIAERLRFEERDQRKQLAPGYVAELPIPPCSYVPLCNSTDIWRRVVKQLPKETRVFNTNERCPLIINFIAKRGTDQKGTDPRRQDVNLDVAEFIHMQFQMVETGTMSEVKEGNEEVDHEESSEEAKEEEKHPEGDPAETSEEDSDNGEPKKSSSRVWSDSHAGERNPKDKGNVRLQRFLRENVVSLPRKLATRLENRRQGTSIMDLAKELQRVPIIEGTRSRDDVDNSSLGDGTTVSVEGSSMMVKDQIVLGDMDEGDIDSESIARAKQIVGQGESWADKSARMLRENADKFDPSDQVEIASLMAKSNDDLRQEVFVMQMIHFYKSLFAKADLPLWLKTYRILSTSKDTGLIEVLTDATSLDALKKAEGYPKEGGLRRYFEETYGDPESRSFQAAQKNFMQSLAAYSLVSYLLGLKDRHNGNIMIDILGRVVFIDFGFAFGMAPGHEFSMERAPFKLTKEMVEVMDGPDSECFEEFKSLFAAGFEEARKNSQIALGLVEIMMFQSNYPCFTGFRYGGGAALRGLQKRLMLRVPDEKVHDRAIGLIKKSLGHKGTYLYDAFQKWSNGYEM